ncbi:MAG: hypothetical protein CMJ18_27780 [Phycisphaeraceae bacterium]|nr:hypothetical protein [Phycisphaeraceae bacterium]
MSLEDFIGAARVGDLKAVESMARAHPEFTHRVLDGKQALHHAARGGHLDVVTFLIQHGANPFSVVYQEHLGARDIAEVNGHAHVVDAIDAWQRARSPETEAGNVLCAAAADGDAARVIELLDRDPASIDDRDREGDTALHIAVRRGDIGLVVQLLERRAPVDVANGAGIRPLQIALRDRGRRGSDPADTYFPLVVAGMLLAAGAEYDLWAASAIGDLDRMELLIKADPQCVNRLHLPLRGAGWPLVIAANHGQMQAVRLLLDRGADPDTPSESDNGYYVAERGHALYSACSNNDLAMAELLLERGTNPDTVIDASGCAMHLAVNHGNQAMIALLLRHGAVLGWDHDPETWQASLTPGFVAQLSDDFTTDAALLQANPGLAQRMLGCALGGGHPVLVEMCLKRGVECDASEQAGLLKEAARMWRLRTPVNPGRSKPEDYYQCFELLLKYGFDPNGPGGLAEGALHALANPDNRPTSLEDDRIACARIALRFGADLSAIGGEARSTPLGAAIRNGWLKLADFFLDQGADPALGGTPAATPLAWATRQGHVEMAERLRALCSAGKDADSEVLRDSND